MPIEIGSINNPKFFKITSGQRDKSSLLYHCKIGKNHYVYKITSINRKTVTLKCKVNGCHAKAYVKIQPDLVIEVADGKKRPNGKTRKAFKVDYSDPRMRKLESYDFYERSSPNHSHPAENLTGGKGLLTAVKKDLREQIGLLSVASGQSEVETVLRAMQIRAQYGCGAQSQIMFQFCQ